MESEKKDSALVRSSAAEYLTFVASTGEDKDSIEMRYEDENIWLTQKMMATLYDVGLPTINEHIKKIYADHEQDEAATIRKFRIVQNEGGRQVTRSVNHYNLQMIIAVGFKVNNQRAVRFPALTDETRPVLTIFFKTDRSAINTPPIPGVASNRFYSRSLTRNASPFR